MNRIVLAVPLGVIFTKASLVSDVDKYVFYIKFIERLYITIKTFLDNKELLNWSTLYV